MEQISSVAALQKLLLSLFIISISFFGIGCASNSLKQVTPQDRELFSQGKFKLDCKIICAWDMAKAQEKLAMLEKTEQWQALADKVMEIGFFQNLTYYYLGRAAEGLGYYDAALNYYTISGSTGLQCLPQYNSCNGIIFPDILYSRIATVKDAKNRSVTWVKQSPSLIEAIPKPTQPALAVPPQDTEETIQQTPTLAPTINTIADNDNAWTNPPEIKGNDEFKVLPPVTKGTHKIQHDENLNNIPELNDEKEFKIWKNNELSKLEIDYKKLASIYGKSAVGYKEDIIEALRIAESWFETLNHCPGLLAINGIRVTDETCKKVRATDIINNYKKAVYVASTYLKPDSDITKPLIPDHINPQTENDSNNLSQTLATDCPFSQEDCIIIQYMIAGKIKLSSSSSIKCQILARHFYSGLALILSLRNAPPEVSHQQIENIADKEFGAAEKMGCL